MQPHEAEQLVIATPQAKGTPRATPQRRQAPPAPAPRTRAQEILQALIRETSAHAVGARVGMSGRNLSMLAYGITEPALSTMEKLLPLVKPDEWFTGG